MERGLDWPGVNWPDVRVGNHSVLSRTYCRCGLFPHALRHLLVGAMPGGHYRSHPGAFTIPAWPLSDYAQWTTYFEATRGLPTFTVFGSWREALKAERLAD